ncbi:CpaF family protein [Neobacillus pocheonensis]|uniref:CpaF family protein n=1 Tax=Neobacillus pocheonensis TaxID=363869 RepID=A0ABT0WDW4_9BACI|nr:CpaF family protein [Neobacillus pocheonensis]
MEEQSNQIQEKNKQNSEDWMNSLSVFGPIFPLYLDEDVSEIMVNGPTQVYCERKGKIVLSPIKFRDNNQVISVIEKIISPLGRKIDKSNPMVDVRLPDGSRVNALIPPLALNSPTITIRKFSKDLFHIEDLINLRTISEEVAIFLNACVKARLNIFVSGGAGSGKTTILNVLSNFIPNDQKIIKIEDTTEIQLEKKTVDSLESRSQNCVGKGASSIRNLVRNSLRRRPDRVIIGEVYGGEALDMLHAMNTGHDGFLATSQSNCPRDMIAGLETMVMLAGEDLPVQAIREQIAGAIDIIIQQSRLKDGSRKIVSITEVKGIEGEAISLQDIFIFKHEGLNSEGKIFGRLMPTGVRPRFYERLEATGIHFPPFSFIDQEELRYFSQIQPILFRVI